MNNKLVKGIYKSAMALSLAFVSHTSFAGIAPPPNSAPTDIGFGLPVVIEAGHDLIEVGGAGNFGTNAPNGDDTSSSVNVSSVFGNGFDFYGINHSATTGFHIGSNGYVVFGNGMSDISPAIAGWNDVNRPFFIMHRGDWDPGNTPVGTSLGGTSTGTNNTYYHLDPTNNIVTVTFDDIDCFSCTRNATSMTASQLRFHDIGSGNFVVEYRYESASTTFGAGQLMGWTAGDLVNFNQDYNTTGIETNSNIDHPGVFAWMFVNGQVVPSGASSNKVLEGSASGTAIGSLAAVDPDAGDTFTYTLLDDADGRFVLTIRNGITYVDVADGGNRLDVDVDETHDIRVRVTDSALNTFEKTLTINVIKVPAFLTSTQIDVPVEEAMNVTIKTRVEQGSAIPTVTASGLPAWMSFADNGDGTVTLSGFPSFELTFRVTLTMTDGFGNQTTRTFNINVKPQVDEFNKDESNSNDSNTTTTTVEVTVTGGDDSGSSFGWLLMLLGGGLLARKRLN